MMFDKAFFDREINRTGTDSVKWDLIWQKYGECINPMWVADMDFEGVPEITEAMKTRAAHPMYGYTLYTDRAVGAMLDFMKRRHGVEIEKDHQIMLPCVITGLKAAVNTFTIPGDGIIIQQPVYYPFNASININHRTVINCPLIMDEKNHYSMDLGAVEKACKDGAKMMFLCNPHNPVGRAWSEKELHDLTEILARYQVFLVSDEIHEDFVLPPNRFISAYLAAPKDLKLICLTSASKSFNLAGLQQAVAYSPDRELINKLNNTLDASGVVSGNIFGMTASEAAYTYGDPWLDGLVAYIAEGADLLRSELAEKLPKAVMTPLEATYLAWLDLSAYGITSEKLVENCRRCGVEFNPGSVFGAEGEYFLRVNLACPHSRISKAVDSLARAVNL